MSLRVSGSFCNVGSMKALAISQRSYAISMRREQFLPRPCAIQCNMLFAGGPGRLFHPNVHLNLQNGRRPSMRPSSRLRSLNPCQTKSDDEAAESVLLDEKSLKHDLQTAIDEENYVKAAEIRDTLKAFHDNSKASVIAANNQFYESFRTGDLSSMQTLWLKSGNACCVHPGAKGITGYEYVMESWEIVWMNYEFPLEIKVKDVQVHVRGDVGYVTCMEFVKTKGGSSWGAQFATNVFERIDGRWFICVHHASPVDI